MVQDWLDVSVLGAVWLGGPANSSQCSASAKDTRTESRDFISFSVGVGGTWTECRFMSMVGAGYMQQSGWWFRGGHRLTTCSNLASTRDAHTHSPTACGYSDQFGPATCLQAMDWAAENGFEKGGEGRYAEDNRVAILPFVAAYGGKLQARAHKKAIHWLMVTQRSPATLRYPCTQLRP